MKKIIIGISVFVLVLVMSLNAWAVTDFIDESGKRIIIKKPFTRIISLYGAHTENLFFLGLEKEMVGVSRNEAYPPQVITKPIFSYHDDAEKFMAAKPDLVLIRPMIAIGYKNLILKLEQAGITVVSLQPNTIEETYSYWKKLGVLTGREKEAEEMVEKFKAGVCEASSFVGAIPPSDRKKVYFEAIHSKMRTFAPSSIATFVLKTAGAVNIADDAETVRETNMAVYGKERILSHADEIDVYIAQKGAMNRTGHGIIEKEGGFQAIKAVREGKIYIVDEKIISRPTMRLLDGIHEIGRILYPEIFNDVSVLRKKYALTRAEFAEMFVKMMNIPLETPDYMSRTRKIAESRHEYGEFVDVDYSGRDYKFIETAVFGGLFGDVDKYRFCPYSLITKKDVTRSIFVLLDLTDEEKATMENIGDSGRSSKQTGADGPVSGEEVFRIVSKAEKMHPKKR